MISYEGLFFEEESVKLIHSLDTNKLEKANDEIHCTFRYHPSEKEIFNELVGQTFEVTLTSYGNNNKNAGFLISLPEELIPFYINYESDQKTLRVPHITSSISSNAIPSETKNLDFKPLSRQYKVKGKFGFCIKDNRGKYISYDKYESK